MPRPTVLLGLLLIAAPAFPATRLTYSINGNLVPVTWASFPVSYSIDRRVAEAIPGGAPQIERAVSEWTTVPGAQISFQDRGVFDGLEAGQDGQSSITMAEDLFANQGFLALTTNWYDDSGHVIEADIQVDQQAIKGGYNLQQLIEHETGHLLGLDHSAVLTSVMCPWIGTSGLASLDSDDRVAIANMYPKSAPNPGATLEGRVTGDGGGIFAAQVVALNDSGEPVATGLTDRDGNYVLQGVPSGNYRVYAEPLDGPVNAANLSGLYRTAKVTSFPTHFADNGTSIRVESGKIYGNLNVNSAGAVQLNPKWVGSCGMNASDVTLGAVPIVLHSGQTATIAVGGDGFVSGMTTFEIANPGFKRVSDFKWSANYVSATFQVLLNAPVGSVVVLAHSGNDSAALTGALRVEPKPRGRAVVASK